jgi:hypothetical protein
MHKYFFTGDAFDIYRLVNSEGKVLWDFRDRFEDLNEDFAMVLTGNSPPAPAKKNRRSRPLKKILKYFIYF